MHAVIGAYYIWMVSLRFVYKFINVYITKRGIDSILCGKCSALTE